MTTGIQLVNLAATQRGKPYRFGAEVDLRNDPRRYYQARAWDCSELTSITCAVFGVDLPDGAFNQWRAVERISVAEGIRTPGALLFRGDGTGGGRNAITHVAFSRGDRWTEEARSTKYGCGSWTALNRFQFAGRIPDVDYRTAAPAPVVLPRRPTVRIGDSGRPAAILNWELHFVTGQDEVGGSTFDLHTVKAMRDLETVLDQEWGDCLATTDAAWSALDFLALARGQLVTT